MYQTIRTTRGIQESRRNVTDRGTKTGGAAEGKREGQLEEWQDGSVVPSALSRGWKWEKSEFKCSGTEGHSFMLTKVWVSKEKQWQREGEKHWGFEPEEEGSLFHSTLKLWSLLSEWLREKVLVLNVDVRESVEHLASYITSEKTELQQKTVVNMSIKVQEQIQTRRLTSLSCEANGCSWLA